MIGGPGSNRDLVETFQELLHGLCKILFWIGVVATVGCTGLLIYTAVASGGANGIEIDKQGVANAHILSNALYAGVTALGVSVGYLFWGEQVAGFLLLLGSIALYTAPMWLPGMAGELRDAGKAAVADLAGGGLVLGIISILIIVADTAQRSRERFSQGSKADLIKYGKGVKEEPDRQNVFMGKCWQLPYCRKFVRDRCPIYHAKRSCWNELVGCMCEEDVIRGAMENRPIPKDALLAAKMIPRNNKLTFAQKKERCKTCVIYNEHQRHKYRAAVPCVLVSFLLIFVVANVPLTAATSTLINKMSFFANRFSFGAAEANLKGVDWFAEGLLVVFFILGLSYALKFLEYLIFDLKV